MHPHAWAFKARFRRHAFGWTSQPAIRRVKEAVAEIKKIARRDPVLAGAGAVMFIERLADHWGDLCESGEVAGAWADRLVGITRLALSPDRNLRGHFHGTSACLSALYRAERYEEIVDLLAVDTIWPYKRVLMGLSRGAPDVSSGAALSARKCRESLFSSVEMVTFLVTLPPRGGPGGTLFPLIRRAVSETEAFAAPVHAPDFKSGVGL